MGSILVKIKKTGEVPCLTLPAYMSPGASGMDLCAALNAQMTLAPMQRCLVPCGFSMEIPEGYEAQVRPRSGLAIRHGVTCLNTPGTIDHDYRGEIKIILINLGDQAFEIKAGDRIAQMVFQKVSRASIEWVDEVSDTSRGVGGFGSTGY